MRSTSSSESEEGEERAAGFVLFRTTQQDRQYLLLRHCNDGHWAFPKGRLEEGEDELDAAMREISEETNIHRLDPISGFRETSEYCLQRSGKQVSKTVAYYLAETGPSEVALSAEHMDFRWVDFDDAVALLTYDESRRILGKADKLLRSKTHPREESNPR